MRATQVSASTVVDVATLAATPAVLSPCLLRLLPLQIPSALQLATLSGVLACLMRHFRASLASLPLLAQPIGTLPIGSWSPDCVPAQQDIAGTVDCSGEGPAAAAAAAVDAPAVLGLSQPGFCSSAVCIRAVDATCT
jgi:hypothetical protein